MYVRVYVCVFVCPACMCVRVFVCVRQRKGMSVCEGKGRDTVTKERKRKLGRVHLPKNKAEAADQDIYILSHRSGRTLCACSLTSLVSYEPYAERSREIPSACRLPRPAEKAANLPLRCVAHENN